MLFIVLVHIQKRRTKNIYPTLFDDITSLFEDVDDDGIIGLKHVTHFVSVDVFSNCVQNAATAFPSELSLCSDDVLHGHEFWVSGRKLTTKAESDILLGSVSGFNKVILLRKVCQNNSTRSSGFSCNGSCLLIGHEGARAGRNNLEIPSTRDVSHNITR